MQQQTDMDQVQGKFILAVKTRIQHSHMENWARQEPTPSRDTKLITRAITRSKT